MENQPTKNLKLIIFVVVFGVIFLWIGPMNIVNFFRGNYPAMKEKQLIGDITGNNFRVQEIEEILVELTLNPGTIDGILDDQTREALKEFQKTQNLKSTGFVEAKTLDALTKQKEILAAAKLEATQQLAEETTVQEFTATDPATTPFSFSSLS